MWNFKKENQQLKPVNYVSVESVDEITEKVRTSGGKVIQPKTTIAGVGSFVIAMDPEGNEIGLLQPEMG